MKTSRSGSVACLRFLVVFSSLVLSLALTGVASAWIGSVEVVPSNPTEQDTVRVRASGWFGDGCWSVSGYGCGWVSTDEPLFEIFGLDVGVPGGYCPMIVIPYGYECTYGVLPAGEYRVTVIEHHESLRDPLPMILEVEFEVGPDTPVSELSWGRIRALYR